MKYIVQPYFFFDGHFKPYFENLLNAHDDYQFVYCNDRPCGFANEKWLRTGAKNPAQRTIKDTIFESLRTIFYLNRVVKDFDTVLFLEYEPLAYRYFYRKNQSKKITILQTIHAVHRMHHHRKIIDFIYFFQRKIFRRTLGKFAALGAEFIVHDRLKKNQLAKIVNEKSIHIIAYPSPKPKVRGVKKMQTGRLLIFGKIRQDKGIYEFLKNFQNQNLNITIAGRIIDKRVKKMARENIENIVFIDEYLNEAAVEKLFAEHDFLLLPYRKNYTGGAGPLKDAFAHATPVICSDIEIFRTALAENPAGILCADFSKLAAHIQKISAADYQQFSAQALAAAKQNNWSHMRAAYEQILEAVNRG